MTWIILAIIGMAGLGYWGWQKGQEQLSSLKSSGFNVTDDLKGEPRLVIDRTNKKLALVTVDNYRVIPMSAVVSSEALLDRGMHMDENFRIELRLEDSVPVSIVFENETLAKAALDKLQGTMR
ncbi:hypothetical protein [Neptunomonas sp.]|uniref:hypothetical protein n=1 Tax=Neptunomonas sp. TaxID=1971898 RepID=UPI0025F6AE3E|nr:hypothetical protein [Neptunomonas sp.]